MRAWAGAFIAVGLMAQGTAPPGAMRGTLLERDDSSSGELTVRARDNHVYCFQFDSKTQVERDSRRTAVADLRKGDVVEVVSTQGTGPRRFYARSVQVLISRPVIPALRYHPLSRTYYNELDDLFPRGNLTFAGIVRQVNDDRLILHTRDQGDARIVLRQDTRYVHDGVQVPLSALRVNARVFIRASRNLDDDIEAYQVMWGEILKPN